MNLYDQHVQAMTRRHFFRTGAMGLGGAALASLMGGEQGGTGFGTSLQAAEPNRNAIGGLPDLPHFAPKAKRAIYLFMAGGPCQMDMLDYKPEMEKMFDKDIPDSITNGQRKTTMTSGQARFPIAPSKFKFSQHGKNGTWISELLPHTAQVVDDIAIIRSVYTEAINHDPAITYICTGNQLPGKASLGAWLSYGLGSENENLPAFMVFTSSWSSKKSAQALYNRLWGSGFLPSKHQGVALRSQGDPVLFLSNPKGVSSQVRRNMLDALEKVNQERFQEVGDPEIQSRIAQYEMAFKMQTSVPELTDISGETKQTLEMYGPEVEKPGTFANHCLLARRMAERGVRFTQIFHRGWDQHGNVGGHLPKQCQDIDQPAAALIQDLKQRGLLDDTLVVWGGEFGRTTYCQGKLSKTNYGRDHHPKCFSVWMAGGGIKGGTVHGATDDFCYNVIENPVHIHDMNATILHCLGINNRRMSYKFQGLDQKITSVFETKVIKEILNS